MNVDAIREGHSRYVNINDIVSGGKIPKLLQQARHVPKTQPPPGHTYLSLRKNKRGYLHEFVSVPRRIESVNDFHEFISKLQPIKEFGNIDSTFYEEFGAEIAEQDLALEEVRTKIRTIYETALENIPSGFGQPFYEFLKRHQGLPIFNEMYEEFRRDKQAFIENYDSYLDRIRGLANDCHPFDPQTFSLAEQVAYLIGLMIADMNLKGPQRSSDYLRLSASERYTSSEKMLRFVKVILARMGVGTSNIKKRDPPKAKLIAGSKEKPQFHLSSKSHHIILYLRNAVLPLKTPGTKTSAPLDCDYLMELPKKEKIRLIQGWADGDGTTGFREHIVAISSMINRPFLQELLQDIGIETSEEQTRVASVRNENFLRAAAMPFFLFADLKLEKLFLTTTYILESKTAKGRSHLFEPYEIQAIREGIQWARKNIPPDDVEFRWKMVMKINDEIFKKSAQLYGGEGHYRRPKAILIRVEKIEKESTSTDKTGGGQPSDREH